jgi:tripartite-type tricarboxylate transporter receptor subunit TctC
MPPVLPHIQAGKLRALAISTPKRMPQLPAVPTFAEVGINGFDVTNWYAIMGPRGLSADVVRRIDAAARKTLADREIVGKLEPQGIIFDGPQSPAEFDAFVKKELSKYARMTKELGIRAD